MTSPEPSVRRRGRLWLTIGEVAAVVGVLIAGLNYWDSHREHVEETKRAIAPVAGPAFVLEASPVEGGRRLALKPVEPRHVIQSQHYIFPRDVLGHAVDLTAAAPRIDASWIAPGLNKALDAAHVRKTGEARVPVAMVTTFLQDGEVRQDRSVYLIGYAWRGHFLGGREIVLQGLALQHRAASGDLQADVDRVWKMSQPSGAGPA
jgi:hypothetical protein